MGVFNRLVRPNGTVRIEALSAVGRDDSGGGVEAYVVVEDNVPVLISQLGGDRDGRFGSRLDKLTGTCTGESPNLDRQDTRLYFYGNNLGMPAGTYAEVVTAVTHGATGERLLSYRWYTVRWSAIYGAAKS